MIIKPFFTLATALSLAIPLFAEDSPASFNFNDWKKSRGTPFDIKEWHQENPSPYRSYFPSTDPESLKKWYISLGPLGVNTLMHDRSWGAFSGCKELFPAALTDEHGLVFNAFEVTGVKSKSPAEGKLQAGDLIVAMDGYRLLGSQHTFLDRKVDNKLVRGLEIHAGQLIDRAEGRGEIKLTVLRLPKSEKANALQGLRKWTTAQTIEVDGKTQISVPLKGADQFRIRASEKRSGVKCASLTLKNADGKSIRVLKISKKVSDLNTLLEVPAGKWTLEGTLTGKKSSQVVVETLAPVDFPAALKKYLKTITLTLDPIGSFGDQYDPEGAKAKNVSAMLAHRLANQQNKDGSWKAGSYASQSFYTSACGLALLSTENPLYDASIKLAAHYVANAGERDKWTYSNGMWLTFLSEYYLKTKDETILPALKMHVANCRRFVMSDYTSGHSAGKPGYGGSGYIGGGGVLALGFAVASHTPAMSEDDLAMLDQMLSRVQEIAPGGKVPYGRVGKSQETTPTPGQSGSCGTGPYFIASLVRGGSELFTKNATHRYSTAPFGSAENGHATQTLHFVWACLSTANCGADAHRQNMADYLWKFTTLREFDGTINKNNYRTEYHNGDGVIGEPYWRTAGYLLILNAHKRNLAITGNPKFRTAPRQLPVVFHRDRAVHNAMLRSWALVEAYLGDKAPAAFTAAVKELRALKSGPQLGDELRAMLKKQAPVVAQSLLSAKDLPKGLDKGVAKGQLVELIMGVSFEASCFSDLLASSEEKIMAVDEKARKKLAKTIQKKQQKLMAQGKLTSVPHRLKIRPVSMMQALTETPAGNSNISGTLFPMTKLNIQVADPSGTFIKKSVSQTMDTTKPPVKKRGKPLPFEKKPGELASFEIKNGQQGKLMVKIEYELAGIPIRYTAPMEIPAPEARNYVPILCRVPVTGTVLEDYADSYSPLVLLETGQVVGCEQRNKPARYLLAGAKYQYQISPGSIWGHDLRAVKPLTPNHRLIKFSSVDGVSNGDLLSDHRYDKGLDLPEGQTEITIKFEKEETIQRVYLSFSPIKGFSAPRVPHTLEAMVDGKWQLLRKGHISGMMPTISKTTTQVRLTLDVGKGGVRFNELHLMTPAPIVKKSQLSW